MREELDHRFVASSRDHVLKTHKDEVDLTGERVGFLVDGFPDPLFDKCDQRRNVLFQDIVQNV